ncbi:MAG: sulfur carrier protein ThiS [Bryobacterales bacterium]|nr:sulfur carrier protein ThiS [Bryobacteraceae bacterium]MDW8131102.1 sulfur carrier protein ThiS [Bryobacterales bacterium]
MRNISVRINGQAREVPAGLTVLGLLEWLQLNPERVAIELNRQILRRPAWSETPLEAGAELEIVHFVGGG